jgi:hypothetical protein
MDAGQQLEPCQSSGSKYGLRGQNRSLYAFPAVNPFLTGQELMKKHVTNLQIDAQD